MKRKEGIDMDNINGGGISNNNPQNIYNNDGFNVVGAGGRVMGESKKIYTTECEIIRVCNGEEEIQ
ncbi:hypothetical protein KPL47_06945 [Clostridium estertheticum]|uniref:hypothetical protein n=1 Tax=Clostridium estertheticum TaxID=238834 RepID=UPI001C0D33D6|nr:hypothetical protein [Clostridium estertheticum]MBU3176104.1 hypothetical protein [Clostridium estertheticum]